MLSTRPVSKPRAANIINKIVDNFVAVTSDDAKCGEHTNLCGAGEGLDQRVLNGISVHVTCAGPQDRPVVLMSNSLAADLTMWHGQAEALAQTYRVIRYDTRGHGRSEASQGDYSLDLLVDDVLALLDAFNVDQVHFVGLSLGGMIGQLLGARAPKRVKSLILCATFAQTSYELWDQRIAAVRASGLTPIVDGTVERWLTAPFRATHDDVIKAARAMISKTSVDGYAGCAAAIRDMDLTHAAEKITAPTLLIAGAEDPSATPDMMRALHGRIRGSEFTVLPDAAHVFTLEKPQAVAERIGTFLAKQD